MTWFYKGQEYEYDENYFGFVYLITNKKNGKKYIGKKFLTSAGYKTVKGKRKKIRKESDWKDYYGSSTNLHKDIEEHGKENFHREILYLCRSRGECTYIETREIFARNALLKENYYNEFVGCKIQASHIKLLREEFNVRSQTPNHKL